MNDSNGGKKNFFFKERVYPVLFMALVTVVFLTIVSGIYLSTEDLVILNETLFLKRAVLYAADIEPPKEGFELEALYQKRIREEKINGENYFQVLNEGGAPAGMVLYGSGPGLWGTITAVLGFDLSGERMTGIEFIEQNETPGLGARIAESWFKEQFRGKRGPFVMVPEGAAQGEAEFDSLTGATRTSRAVLTILNAAVAEAADKAQEANK